MATEKKMVSGIAEELHATYHGRHLMELAIVNSRNGSSRVFDEHWRMLEDMGPDDYTTHVMDMGMFEKVVISRRPINPLKNIVCNATKIVKQLLKQ